MKYVKAKQVKKREKYNWCNTNHMDPKHYAEDDEDQIAALLVDRGFDDVRDLVENSY